MFWKRRSSTRKPPRAHVQPPRLGAVMASPDGRSRALVVKVDHPGATGSVFPEVVVHVMAVRHDGTFEGHFPFAPEAFATADEVGHLDPDGADFPQEWREGRDVWAVAVREGGAGIFSVPIEALF